MLTEMPAMMGEAMESMMPIIRKRMDAITARVQEEVAQMMKDSKTKPGQNPQATAN